MPTGKKNRNRLIVVGGLVAAGVGLLWLRGRSASSSAGSLPYSVTPAWNYPASGGLIPLAPITYNLGQETSQPVGLIPYPGLGGPPQFTPITIPKPGSNPGWKAANA